VARFLFRRLIEAIAALFSITILLFALLHLDTTSPARAMLGQMATPQKVALLNARLGLTLPMPEQFVLWLKATMWEGELGTVIQKALPPTLELLILGSSLAFVLAIFIARIQVRHARSLIDRGLSVLIGILTAIPGFWLGSLLLFLFAITYPLFPPTGFPVLHHGIGTWAWHEILPVSTLALTSMGPWARHLRTSLESAGMSEYVRTARAKGVRERDIVARHTFKNSLLPFVTLVGLSLPTMLNTVIALEVIYAIPGAGQALINSLDGLLFANATTIALVLAFVTVLGSLGADLVYGLVDPRIQYR